MSSSAVEKLPEAIFGPELAETLAAFLGAGLMLDPWLAGLHEEHFSFESQELIERSAESLASDFWREPLISGTVRSLPTTRSLGRKAAVEVLYSTAAVIAHDRVGRINVDLEIAREAIVRLESFIRRQGFGALVRAYGVITFAENHGAVAHYGALPEEEFISGVRHRPWVRAPLDDELISGLAMGTYRLLVRDGRRWVMATPKGKRSLADVRRLLAASGYLAERLRLAQLSQFNLMADYDRLVSTVVPAAAALRLTFTDFACLEPGMAVLDVGCGMGSQIFEGGLWEVAGPEGRITGLDPAVGMLERARAKASARGASNVQFVQGRGEALPFPDGGFDAAVGISFLYLTQAPQVVRELARVTRPGGIVAIGEGCESPTTAPWVAEWLEPVLAVLAKHNLDGQVRHFLPGEVPALLRDAGLEQVESHLEESPAVFADPEASVFLMVRSTPVVQQALELLPWAARQELVDELIRRGRAISARLPLEERRLSFPVEWTRAVVTGA